MLHIKKITPMYNAIVTTADKYEEDMLENGFYSKDKLKGTLKEYQTVLAVGTTVRDLKVGDRVMINFNNYVVRKYDKNSLQNDLDNNPKKGIFIPTVEMDDEKGNPRECLFIYDRDILYSFVGEEVKENIIIPNKPEIIVS